MCQAWGEEDMIVCLLELRVWPQLFFLVHRWPYSYYNFAWRKELLEVSFIRAQIHIWRLDSHDLSTSQRSHLHTPSQWGLGFNIRIGGGYKHLICSPRPLWGKGLRMWLWLLLWSWGYCGGDSKEKAQKYCVGIVNTRPCKALSRRNDFGFCPKSKFWEAHSGLD